MIVLRRRWGRVWTGRLEVAAAIRMRDLAGIDVMELVIDGLGELKHVARVVDALYAIMLPELGRMKPRRFGRVLRAMPANELQAEIVDAVNEFFAQQGPPREPVGKPRTPSAIELWQDVWWMAGVLRIDPANRTFGELAAMVEGHDRDVFPRHAQVLSEIVNNGFERKVRVRAADIDPTGVLKKSESESGGRQKLEITADDIGTVARILGRR